VVVATTPASLTKPVKPDNASPSSAKETKSDADYLVSICSKIAVTVASVTTHAQSAKRAKKESVWKET
jgi:hypothetical protein